jgi:Rap1a immunity proteins
MKALVVAILPLALTMPASAEDTDSANLILPQCKGFLVRESSPPPLRSEVFRQGLCAGFVAGIVSAGPPNLCLPKEVTADQVVAVAIKYIEARPERMHENFGKLAQEAMIAAWPCKR